MLINNTKLKIQPNWFLHCTNSTYVLDFSKVLTNIKKASINLSVERLWSSNLTNEREFNHLRWENHSLFELKFSNQEFKP